MNKNESLKEFILYQLALNYLLARVCDEHITGESLGITNTTIEAFNNIQELINKYVNTILAFDNVCEILTKIELGIIDSSDIGNITCTKICKYRKECDCENNKCYYIEHPKINTKEIKKYFINKNKKDAEKVLKEYNERQTMLFERLNSNE